jgi:SsrA-binding protein
MATKKQDTSSRIADNKKAAYNYFFEERFEAGMVLEGWEVKSLREGKVQLTDGYVVIRDGELFVIGCQINPCAPHRRTSIPTPCGPRSCCCTRSRFAA